jgi:acetyl esterase/lipase
MDAIELYDGPAPGSEDWIQPEQRYASEALDTEVITNVSVPTIIPVLPAAGSGNGAAVIIAPGGGYHVLSIRSEGLDVAERLAAHGIAAFVLTYRLVQCEGDAVAEMGRKATSGLEEMYADMNRVAPLAAADAAAAMRLVRSRAGDFGVDAGCVGFMGFSAGGNVAVRAALTDDPAARPDFVAPIYATLTGVDLGAGADAVPDGSGPMFLVAATDDELGLARDSITLYQTWRRARLPVELHMYARGGHGFGMRTQHLPSDSWIDRFVDWFEAWQPERTLRS